MALRFSLTLCAALLASLATCQTFGRFGYVDFPSIAGLSVDRAGFAAKHARADKLRFNAPLAEWKPTTIASDGMSVNVGGRVAYQPQRIRFHLTSPGFSAYFPMGMRLRSSATGAPYVSWAQGSAANGVPTPRAPWILLSFRDDQPPVALGFPESPASVQISGKPGAWTIQTPLEYSGWVRIGLPLGTKGSAANSAASLGRLVQTVKAQEEIWTHLAPSLLKTEIESDLLSVTAKWTFDQQGAIVPNAAVFSDLGGYPLKVLSPSQRTVITTEEGPTEILKGKELYIRFPIRRVPTGRGLVIGAQLTQPLGTASPLDIPSVVDLALESLVAGRDKQTVNAAEETLGEYLAQAHYLEEKWTRQQLPYNADGKDIDLAAAHAFLMQVMASMSKPGGDPNALLTSVQWRQDWLSWLPASVSTDVGRRAAALFALGSALCPEQDRRLAGGMFQAGLAAERGLNTWRRRNGLIPVEPPLLEPMLGLRQGIFGLKGSPAQGLDFAANILSPIRVFSEGPALLSLKGADLVVSWPAIEAKPSRITLASSYPLALTALTNLSRMEMEHALGLYELRYTPEAAGTCEAKLVIPTWAKPPPPAAPTPRYSEPKR